MTAPPKTIYDREGHALGTIQESARSRRWFWVRNRVVGPARFFDRDDAADALRAVVSSEAASDGN
jgi:hypothetical protein